MISEYYDLLGLVIGDVMGSNPDEIWPLLDDGERYTDDLKHLANSLDLQAKAIKAMGRQASLASIHALKFYSMAHALNSFVKFAGSRRRLHRTT